MKYAYLEDVMRPNNRKLVDQINVILDTYARQGYVLSVRQVYYQLVAHDVVPNTLQDYKRVASVINDGRMFGLIDWDMIEDRNRDIVLRTRWNSGEDILRASANSYHMDMWGNQPERVMVIVEKAALEGVLGRVCEKYDVPLLAARGYPSVSILRELVLTHFEPAISEGQPFTILHFGDHDPSGLDMTRDLTERCELFLEGDSDQLTVVRVALNMDQIDELKPPPNPAKMTDSRFKGYMLEFGFESWELDAIEPAALATLATDQITRRLDSDAWDERAAEVEEIRTRLTNVADKFDLDEDDRKREQ
jgi:pentatricopeptide repeat protein